ncbi:MAG: hypothetical protein NTZ05_18880 [Chloroflexi bacterium]|nr:hypothetical protein [Chloroflexota bacterium]
MAEKKAFLLRLDAGVYNALQKWASDDLRSVNAQVEFLLRAALKDASRLPARHGTPPSPEHSGSADSETTP